MLMMHDSNDWNNSINNNDDDNNNQYNDNYSNLNQDDKNFVTILCFNEIWLYGYIKNCILSYERSF